MLSKRQLLAMEICNSEAMMWVMAGSDYEEMWLNDLREAYKNYVRLGGGYPNA